MQTRFISTTIFLAIIFAVVFLLLFANSIPASSVVPTNSVSTVQDGPAKRAEIPTEVGELDTNAIRPASPKLETLHDGQSLLESHCIQCHNAQWFKQIDKSRTEWEQALARMDRLGVHMSDGEKVVLIDYLSVNDEP
jgi:hypothetical protein